MPKRKDPPAATNGGDQTNSAVQPNATRVAVRIFFLDKENGSPVQGLLVTVLSDRPSISSQKSASASQQPLASLQTDHAGYVSFKFELSALAGSTNLTVIYGTGRANPFAVNVADSLAGNDTYIIQVDVSAEASVIAHLGLPSIIAPDPKDLVISPGSLGSIPHLSSKGGLCQQLMPTTMAERRFRAFVIRPINICDPLVANCPDKVQFVRGKMLEYEIIWTPSGSALGELLNTISLAPCEQVNIAIADWMRQEAASRSEATDVQQQSFQEMNHDRLIAETMQSSVNTKSSAWGVGGSIKGNATIPIKGVDLDLTSVFAGGYSQSSLAQNVAASTTNQLSERITQAATYVASQRSTVVFQATASEQQTYQTRTMRNNNHCHTLNLMYYQVNRNYNVETDYKGERDVVLIKYDNPDFDAMRAFCNAELLKPALLDPGFTSAFDELADALFCCGLTPAVPPPPTGQKLLMDSLTMTVKPKDVGLQPPTSIAISLHSATGQQPIAFLGFTNINPYWQPGGVHTQIFNLQSPIDPAQVAWMEIDLTYWGNKTVSVILNEIDVTYHAVGNGDFSLYSSQAQTPIDPSFRTPVKAQLPGQQAQPTSGANDCVTKSCPIQKLLGHLNCHKRYYNSILWLNEDPNDRVSRWSCCNDQEGFALSLISQIENEPITVYGDFLVFAGAGSQLVGAGSVPPVSTLVTMPTPGVFTEGILGQCNTCEKSDETRFWNWKDSPCPDCAPDIPTPATPPATTSSGDLKADTISNLINLTAPPDAPEGVIKDLVSELVKNADEGSSEAKDLLEKLLDGLMDSVAPKKSGD